MRVLVERDGKRMGLSAERAHLEICNGADLIAGHATYEAYLEMAGLPHPSQTVWAKRQPEEGESNDADDTQS